MMTTSNLATLFAFLIITLATRQASAGPVCVVPTNPFVSACESSENPDTTGQGLFGQDDSTSYAPTNAGVWGSSEESTGVYGSSGGASGVGVEGYCNTGTGVLGSSSSSLGVWGESTHNIGVVGTSGTSTIPSVTAGVVGNGSGSSVYGGYFSATSDNGVYATSSGNDASYGLASTSGYAGVHGQSTNAGGYGVYGNNTATSGYAFGGYFDSNYGIGLAGITGNSAGGFGAGVYASGSKYGVWGQPTGGLSGAIGVYGTDDSNDSSYGIEAVANGRGSTALEALANGANTTAIYALGNVNIVSGCLEFNGVSYHGTCASDERLKKNIQPVKAGLDELAKLRPVSFDWIDPTAHAGSRGETGFLAQEVAKVFPQWVGTRSDGFLTLEIPPRELAGLLVNALRTLKTDNDDLRQEVGELRGQVTAIASGHPIPASGFNFGGSNVGLLGLAAAIAYAASRRKPNEKQS